MRSRSRATLGAAIAAAFVATVGCVPEPDVEVTSGTVESREFSDHVKYYDLDLPADVRALEWLQLRDWDTNQIYLRFSTDHAGLAKLLGDYRLSGGALKPPTLVFVASSAKGIRLGPGVALQVHPVAAEHVVNVPNDRASRGHELERADPVRGPLGRPSRR